MTHYEAITELATYLAKDEQPPKGLMEWAEQCEAAEKFLQYVEELKLGYIYPEDTEQFKEELEPYDLELFQAALQTFWKHSRYSCWHCKDEKYFYEEEIRWGEHIDREYPCGMCTAPDYGFDDE